MSGVVASPACHCCTNHCRLPETHFVRVPHVFVIGRARLTRQLHQRAREMRLLPGKPHYRLRTAPWPCPYSHGTATTNGTDDLQYAA
ncbi:uncharacterized protein YALI1_E20334g [Yarrowia lipolytica]|uniref:Uncharacterized protein n=1 Tax=Yarrowia lipolytica TaxID=4952 RepID=A0A1D8NIS3_YARLL|nr:hypothetical protein YALI1_E20334g [Yarrowia lipolytica]